MPKMTAEELEEQKQALSLLSPEERAALGDDEEEDIVNGLANGKDGDDDDDDDGKAKADPADDDQDDGNDDADDDDGADDDTGKAGPDDAAKTDAGAAEEAAAKAADAAEAAKTEPPEEVEPIALDLKPIEEGYQAHIKQLDDNKAVEFQKLMNGESTAEAYAKIESEYMRDRDAARDQKAEKIAWFKEVNNFQNDVLKNDRINYAGDPKMNSALDRWVKVLAADSDNASKDGAWFLREAHKNVKLQYNIEAKQADAKPKAEAPAEKPGKEQQKPNKEVAKRNGRAPNLSTLPPTLAGVPAAAETDAEDGGEFAHLDKLDGIAYERAIAKMTEEQRERWAQGR